MVIEEGSAAVQAGRCGQVARRMPFRNYGVNREGVSRITYPLFISLF
jgi:hypothetical protein